LRRLKGRLKALPSPAPAPATTATAAAAAAESRARESRKCRLALLIHMVALGR